MPSARFPILLLPQAGVAFAYLRFQRTAFANLEVAAGSMQFGLLTDTMVVVTIGLMALVANLLIAAALLKIAVKFGADNRAGRSEPTAGLDVRSTHWAATTRRRPTTPSPRRDPRPAPVLGRGRIDPRRVEGD